MAVSSNTQKKWEKVREFALGLPGAAEEFPRDESVANSTRADLPRTTLDEGTSG
jgi:hypothetical protein